MNTTDLIDRVATEHGMAKDHVRKILDSTFGAITAAGLRGDEVALSGFGKFKVTDRAERQRRNPATGEAITIPAARKLSFVPAKNIRDAFNAPADQETCQGLTAEQTFCGSSPARIDRLARSMKDLEEKWCQAEGDGASVDTTTAAGRSFLDMLDAFAEFATNLFRERQLEGIAAATVGGVQRSVPRLWLLRCSGHTRQTGRKASGSRMSLYQTPPFIVPMVTGNAAAPLSSTLHQFEPLGGGDGQKSNCGSGPTG